MSRAVEEAIAVADATLARLEGRSPSANVRAKLRNLHDVCRRLVGGGGIRLSVPHVVRAYAARFPAAELSLAESSIRNKRNGANPYQELYRVWEGVAEVALISHRPGRSKAAPGEVLSPDELAGIDDLTLKHRVSLVLADNRSLKAQLDVLKKVRGAPVVQIGALHATAGAAPRANDLGLTEAEVEALRNLTDPRKLRARHMRTTDDGAIELLDGRPIGDPGLVQALEKIVRSYTALNAAI
jgi:hypothetical protein